MPEHIKPEGYIPPEEWYPALPKKRMSVAAVFEDEDGLILIETGPGARNPRL